MPWEGWGGVGRGGEGGTGGEGSRGGQGRKLEPQVGCDLDYMGSVPVTKDIRLGVVSSQMSAHTFCGASLEFA